jgi:hypothetical protein
MIVLYGMYGTFSVVSSYGADVGKSGGKILALSIYGVDLHCRILQQSRRHTVLSSDGAGATFYIVSLIL